MDGFYILVKFPYFIYNICIKLRMPFVFFKNTANKTITAIKHQFFAITYVKIMQKNKINEDFLLMATSIVKIVKLQWAMSLNTFCDH